MKSFETEVASLDGTALMRLLASRHSVRQFTQRALAGEIRAALEQEIAACNEESGLSIQLC